MVILDVQNISAELRRREGADRHQLRRARARGAPSSAPTARARARCSTASTASTSRSRAPSPSAASSFKHMNSRQVAEMGVARTFQNLALFKGMSVLDNIMTGPQPQDEEQPARSRRCAGARPSARSSQQREFVERIIDFLEIQLHRKTPVGRLPYGLQKRVDLGRALATEPQAAAAGRADGRHERGEEAGHEPLHPRRQRRVRHHHRADRARHGRGDGHLATAWWCSTTARRSATARPTTVRNNEDVIRRLPRHETRAGQPHGIFPGNPDRRPDGGHAVSR